MGRTELLLGGSWDLVSRVISTLIGVISIVTLIITLVTKSQDPLSIRVVQGFMNMVQRRRNFEKDPSGCRDNLLKLFTLNPYPTEIVRASDHSTSFHSICLYF